MSRPTLVSPAALAALAVAALAAAAPAAGSPAAASPAVAHAGDALRAPNPIHPVFAPLGAAGGPARRAEDVSADATCGACHDARFVAAHSRHAEGPARATCIDCHVDGGRLELALGPDGRLVREAIRIGRPTPERCGSCHGVVSDGAAPVVLPAALLAAPEGGRTFSLTLGQGAIVAPQRMSESYLNLEGKEALAAPWDVHAAKLVDCAACHHAANDPDRAGVHRERLAYVAKDPRRTGKAEFLHRPDHRLAEPDCRSCHAPERAHAFLPYRARHLAVLACQACHVPGPMGPAAEMIDATVATPEGTPAVRLRNVELAPGAPLNAATVHPLRPLLVEREGPDGAVRLAPVNLVARWRWVGADGAEVPFERVARAFAEDAARGGRIAAALDADRDGAVSPRELRLERPEAVAALADALRGLGVEAPRIEGVLDAHPLSHGVQAKGRALRDCTACHAEDSRLGGEYLVASYLPGGVPPRPRDGARVALAGAIVPSTGGGLAFRRQAAGAGGRHVLGHTREAWTNLAGFAVFAAVVLGVAVHALARVIARRRRGAPAHAHPHPASEKVYAFRTYERIWHWTMAISGVVLIATGLVVHLAGRTGPGVLAAAVTLHNGFAVVLVVNAFLGLFWHLTTAAIRHLVPAPEGLLRRILAHVDYQQRGIFAGEPHPPNAPGHKLNPLQQLTYLALLNVLFPLQIATGLLVWAVGHWPALGVPLRGLTVIAPLHNLGAWLFLAFFVLHTYLVTTGRTVGEHLATMITGWQHAEPSRPGAEGSTP